jgi:molybdenum cofactor cytidylyltransferase
MTVGAIILAAGSSRRFGDDKRKQLLPSGATVLQQTIARVAEVLDPVLVVLRFGDQPFLDELKAQISDPRVSYLLAPDSALGMAHSLGNAIHSVKTWDAAVVFLGDMPFVHSDTIQRILAAYEQHRKSDPIILPTVAGKPGHPVLFGRAWFEEIESLRGDTGARAVIDAHADKVIQIPVEDQGAMRDIDTPEDLQR